MLLKSLRTSIGVNLALLLLLGMLLIDLVMLIVSQEVLIKSEISKGRNALLLVENIFHSASDERHMPAIDPTWVNTIDNVLETSGIACFVFISPQQRHIESMDACAHQAELIRLAEMAAQRGIGSVTTHSSIRDVFWQQAGYIIVAETFRYPGASKAGAAALIPLDSLYRVLRHTQHIFLIYILINTLILTLLGVYRLNRLTVKPIQRLVSRAETYRDSSDTVFLIEKEDNEFSKLSKSLNSMLLRISQDKEKLKDSVDSLERANRELEKAQLDLIRAEKLASVGRLSAGIAHEIGNPIGIIKGYLDLLKDDGMPAKEKEDFIRRTETEVERINSIIRQLLDFARPSAQEQSVVGIHAILSELKEICHFQPVFADLNFSLDLRAEKDQVMADGRQLRQVFLNLILNAADAFEGLDSPDQNRLIIRTFIEADARPDHNRRLAIQFIDNGAGIPDEHRDNIFDPFYTTKDPGRGTGLGLSVSFTIIEGFGGSIKAEPNDLHGTTMCIRLPLMEASAAPRHYQADQMETTP
ncbi:MAG: ATP-binding protein [Desulfobacterales bacterium]|jgi:signal transduction histidine kinase